MYFNFEIESPYFTFWNETTLILDCGARAGGRPEFREVVTVVVAAVGGGAATAAAVVVCYGNLVQ